MRLTAQLVGVGRLTKDDRDAMFTLMDRHYVNVQRPIFDADLNEKQWIIQILESDSGKLCGFSTQRMLEVSPRPAGGEGPGVRGRVKALFSGDTIIDREHWGDPALARAWGRLALSIIDAHPDAELYWFLISQGYKTYRFLPIFFVEYYPHPEIPTPAWASALIDTLALARNPEDYDRAAGIIRAGRRQYRLRAGVADITNERLADAHVRFFQDRNPAHARGDELCCLAPLTRANFTRAAYRVIGNVDTAPLEPLEVS